MGQGWHHGREGIHHVINLCSSHALTDILRDIIQQGRVYLGTLADAIELFLSAQQLAIRHVHATFHTVLCLGFCFLGAVSWHISIAE